MSILVTGGCGYIGSHVTRLLSERGHQVIVVDNLSTGSRSSLLHGEILFTIDLADTTALETVFRTFAFTSVFHFAASIDVAESLNQPLSYYENNTTNTLRLLQCCARYGVKNFIFSSTAAVYGDNSGEALNESHPLKPSNPYAASKAMAERIIRDTCTIDPMHYVILRYFNVAGASHDGRLGHISRQSRHLIKVACEAALGKRPSMQIYGTDYATPDGTCIRDFIHIEDLARAHIHALDYLLAGGDSDTFNCGYGQGLSVRQIVEKTKHLSNFNFPAIAAPRRSGDVPAVIADNTKILRHMGWKPLYNDIDTIIASALNWEKRIPPHAIS